MNEQVKQIEKKVIHQSFDNPLAEVKLEILKIADRRCSKSTEPDGLIKFYRELEKVILN